MCGGDMGYVALFLEMGTHYLDVQEGELDSIALVLALALVLLWYSILHHIMLYYTVLYYITS